jgi:DNA-binding NtrC family response regulator
MIAGEANNKVLIIDSDREGNRALLELCAKKAITATVTATPGAGAEFVEDRQYGLVFLSMGRENARSRIELAASIKARRPELPIVGMAEEAGLGAQEAAHIAVAAIQAGCADLAVKPVAREQLARLLETFLPSQNVPMMACGKDDGALIVGKSARLAQTIELARRAAPTTAAILISGESGTGKELIAQLIHSASCRAQGPYIRVNCAALNDSLLESELFGHEKGAFTGALAQRKGRFEQADGGTLLLDEITETGPRLQAQLLRVLEEQDFERVGGNENIEVNVRVISTTNRDLGEEVRQGKFRADLYYRLGGIRLTVPPLRERIEDIEGLVWHFVNHYARESRRHIRELDGVMLEIFSKFGWPGNIRQLRNVVRTSLTLGAGPILSLSDVSWLIDELEPVCTKQAGQAASGCTTLEEMEQQAIVATLRQTSGNQSRAAKILGISDRTLREKVRRYRDSVVAAS